MAAVAEQGHDLTLPEPASIPDSVYVTMAVTGHPERLAPGLSWSSSGLLAPEHPSSNNSAIRLLRSTGLKGFESIGCPKLPAVRSASGWPVIKIALMPGRQ